MQSREALGYNLRNCATHNGRGAYENQVDGAIEVLHHSRAAKREEVLDTGPAGERKREELKGLR